MKFFIILALLLFVAMCYKTYEQYDRIQNTQRRIALNESRSLSAFIAAFRTTYQDIFKDKNISLNDDTINLLPVKTLTNIVDLFSSSVQGNILIRTVSDRPRNIKNMANDFELERINYFKRNPQEPDSFIQRDDMYYYTKPLLVRSTCMRCHGKREDAPVGIRERYDNAYGYKIGETRGLISIQIQESSLVSNVYAEFQKVIVNAVLLYLVLLGIIYTLFQKIRFKDKQYTEQLEEEILEKTYELKKQKEILYNQAHHDALTGLPNRALFADRLKHAIVVAKRHEESLALLFIDIDNFKNINDTFGHHIGDEMLVEIANRFKSSIRSNDTLARLGGDEFTVIIEGLRSVNEVSGIVGKIQKSLHAPIDIHGNVFHISCSIGISLCPQDGIEPNALMKYADKAMYKAKKEGKNNFQFHSSGV